MLLKLALVPVEMVPLPLTALSLESATLTASEIAALNGAAGVVRLRVKKKPTVPVLPESIVPVPFPGVTAGVPFCVESSAGAAV